VNRDQTEALEQSFSGKEIWMENMLYKKKKKRGIFTAPSQNSYKIVNATASIYLMS